MKLRRALLASAMMALPMVAANAQAIDGLYVGGGLGANFLQREDLTASVPGSASKSGNVRSQVGPVINLDLGWGFGNGLRAEGEINYRANSGFNNPQGFGPASAGGTEQKYGLMANVMYDFVGVVPMIQPYVGVGVGYQEVKESNLHGYPVGGGGFAELGGKNQGSFAYQAILGAAIPTGVPGLAVTAEYRFMGLAGNRDYTATFSTGAGSSTGKVSSTSDYNHSLLLGVRYAFNQAPPAVAAAMPMPAVDNGAKTFLVFFDWDRADLTPQGAGVVRDAAGYSTHNQYTRIDVDGNTDTSGTPAYNQGLSERRARVVAADLVRNGVPQAAISMHAYGDTKLLVATGPGVREPQNRRVEIVFH